jgi:hypothetical protein
VDYSAVKNSSYSFDTDGGTITPTENLLCYGYVKCKSSLSPSIKTNDKTILNFDQSLGTLFSFSLILCKSNSYVFRKSSNDFIWYIRLSCIS